MQLLLESVQEPCWSDADGLFHTSVILDFASYLAFSQSGMCNKAVKQYTPFSGGAKLK